MALAVARAVAGSLFLVPGAMFSRGRTGNAFAGATLVVARHAGRHKTGPYSFSFNLPLPAPSP